jgi:chromosome condensin MukBEF ATPase and DNA-binding subunit MukB
MSALSWTHEGQEALLEAAQVLRNEGDLRVFIQTALVGDEARLEVHMSAADAGEDGRRLQVILLAMTAALLDDLWGDLATEEAALYDQMYGAMQDAIFREAHPDAPPCPPPEPADTLPYPLAEAHE